MDRITDDRLPPLDEYLESSSLSDEQTDLILAFAAHLDSGRQLRAIEIARGLGGALKVAVKPDGYFAFVLKLDEAAKVEQEIAGDRLVRLRIPPTFIPDLVWTGSVGPTGAIAYRYITRGRVAEPPDRMDVWVRRVPRDRALRFVHLLYEVGLKKMHWIDGSFSMRPTDPPRLSTFEPVHAPTVRSQYQQQARALGTDVLSPHGVVHGDLHPKNVLVDIGEKPLLIDFPLARIESPIVQDFARMEAHLVLQSTSENEHTESRDTDYSLAAFLNIADRLYSPGELILPRSARPVASIVHDIRSSYWRGCLSRSAGMHPEDVDAVYRTFLAAEFARFLVKRNVDGLGVATTPAELLAYACFSFLVGTPIRLEEARDLNRQSPATPRPISTRIGS